MPMVPLKNITATPYPQRHFANHGRPLLSTLTVMSLSSCTGIIETSADGAASKTGTSMAVLRVKAAIRLRTMRTRMKIRMLQGQTTTIINRGVWVEPPEHTEFKKRPRSAFLTECYRARTAIPLIRQPQIKCCQR